MSRNKNVIAGWLICFCSWELSLRKTGFDYSKVSLSAVLSALFLSLCLITLVVVMNQTREEETSDHDDDDPEEEP